VKSSRQLRLSGKKPAVVAKRAAVEAARENLAFVLGEPPRPAGMERNQRRAWAALCAELLARKVLAKTDGTLLLDLMAARSQIRGGINSDGAKKRIAEIVAEFDARKPFDSPKAVEPKPEADSHVSLAEFKEMCARERDSFESRIVSGQSITLDEDGRVYDWREGDATVVAHKYAQDIFGGIVVSGDLTKRMAARHLDDMKTAHERGFVWDVCAARNIVTWFEKFCGLEVSTNPWEVFVLASIFAWKQPTGYRRFTEAWLSVGRKNGKTAIAAAIGLWGLVIGDGEKYQEVYFGATKKDQARIGWRDAARMKTESPELRDAVKKYASSLTVEETDSFAQPLSSDVRSADGTRPSFVIADELHEWDRGLYDKLISGMVLRKNRLMVCTTTAGDNLTSFCAMKEDFLEKILTGVSPDDGKFVAIYRMEKEWSYKDDSKWLASNPNLGVTLMADSLRNQLTEIENDASALNGFLRFHCNQWVTMRAGHTFSMDKIDACRGAAFPNMDSLQIREWALKELAGKTCFGGFDYGESNDLCAATLLFPDIILPGEKVAKPVVLPWFWMPTDNLQQREKLWRVPLSSWSRSGLLRLIDGDITSPKDIGEQLAEITSKFRVVDWRFDRAGGTVSMFGGLQEEHRIKKSTAFAFSIVQTTVPSKEIKLAVQQGCIAMLDNPILRWMFGNVQMQIELNGLMLPKKANGDYNRKIDGVSALVCAWHTWKDPANKTVTPRVFSF
jgi:phage terminase large subunit-like protein